MNLRRIEHRSQHSGGKPTARTHALRPKPHPAKVLGAPLTLYALLKTPITPKTLELAEEPRRRAAVLND